MKETGTHQQQQRKSSFKLSSGKKNVDSLIKDLEKELSTVQNNVVDGFNKLERKI